jgi:hypothetical protein
MTDVVFNASNASPKGLKELKGIQSSKMSRRNFFNFLAELDLEDTYSKKDTPIYAETKSVKPKLVKTKQHEPDMFDDILKLISKQYENKNTSRPEVKEIEIETKKNLESENISKENSEEEESKEEIKCEACMKTFSTNGSLKRHQDRNKVCVDWINIYKNVHNVQLTKGIHIIIEELLDKSLGDNDELECKYCKTRFTTKGNHHKHFNTATVCNRLAYQEFKKLFNAL